MTDNQHVKNVIIGLNQPKVSKNQSSDATEPYMLLSINDSFWESAEKVGEWSKAISPTFYGSLLSS